MGWTASIGLCGGLIYLLSPILTPFLLAAVIAYICNPMVTWLEFHKISRTLGTVLVMLLAISALSVMVLIMLPLFEKEISRLIERLPFLLDALKIRVIPWLEANFNLDLQLDIAAFRQIILDHWQSAGGMAVKMLPGLKIGGLVILEFIMNVLLLPVVLFYLLRDWTVLTEKLRGLIPPSWQEEVLPLIQETDRVLAEFMRGQIAVIIIMSGYFITGLWLVGLEFALPIGLTAGVLVFVPYLGAIVGLVLATLAVMTQFQEWSSTLAVWSVIGSGQLLESMLITPRLVGERIGLHPVAVIFALLAFGQLFGFIGILLALPVSAVLLVWLRHLHSRYLEAIQSDDREEIRKT